MGRVILYQSLKFIFVLLALFLVHCGISSQGGSEVGNPPDATTRPIAGQLTTNMQALFRYATSDGCPADQLIAMDSSANTTLVEIDENCSFTTTLTINKAYLLSFTLNDVFVASMIFNNSPSRLSSQTFVLSSGSTTVNLGTITINGTTATPANEPSEQCDSDGDGVDDYNDDDDDDDGTPDESEEDCDLDGYDDDYDDDTSDCTENDDDDDDNDAPEDSDDSSSSQAKVLEVRPHHDNNLTDNIGLVSLSQDVEVRFGCSLDTNTITSSNFSMEDENSNIVSCDFEIENDDTRIDCEHTDFLPDTIYTALLSGIKCADGTVIPVTEWSWRTETND